MGQNKIREFALGTVDLLSHSVVVSHMEASLTAAQREEAFFSQFGITCTGPGILAAVLKQDYSAQDTGQEDYKAHNRKVSKQS